MGGQEGELPQLLALHGGPGVQTHEDTQAAFWIVAGRND
jgi:hypothetical protein